MRSLAPRLCLSLLLGAAGPLACSDDDTTISPIVDAGSGDAQITDRGEADAGPVDSGDPDRDAGPDDASAQNPQLLFQGQEPIGNGQRLYLEGRGTLTSTNNPVLFLGFLPGFGSDYWVPESAFIYASGDPDRPDRALVYVDLVAQGRSGIANDDTGVLTAQVQALSLGNAIQHLRTNYFDPQTRFDVIAHGYGGLMASLFDAANPGVIDRLVLVSPYPSNVEIWSEWQETYKTDARYDGKAFVDLQISPRCMRDSNQCEIDLFRIYGITWVCAENTEAFFELSVRNANRVGQGTVDFRLRNDAYSFDDAIANVVADTTIITGACDPIPEEGFQLYEDLIDGAQRVRIEDSGFFPMTEARDAFQRAVKDALSRDNTNP